MTVINKQKFLAELGRLLTFMSDEDRIEALALYEKMFDDASDEQVLLSALQSPTRQAVVIARAYDSGARGQAADAPEGEAAEDATPNFVRAILKVYEDSVPLAPEPAPAPIPAPAPAPEVEPAAPVEAEIPAVIENQVSLFEETAPAEEPQAESAEEAEEPSEEEKVDVFLSDFSIEAEQEPTEEPKEEEEDEEENELRAWIQGGQRPEHTARERIVRSRHGRGESDDGPETRTATSVPLLILFVIFAVPLTVCGIALLLFPTLLSLLLAAATIVAGCGGLLAAFSGFAVFADILIVFGCAVVALALGLLFLWLFIWFVVGPIAGLIRWVMRLGAKWCSKEVPA